MPPFGFTTPNPSLFKNSHIPALSAEAQESRKWIIDTERTKVEHINDLSIVTPPVYYKGIQAKEKGVNNGQIIASLDVAKAILAGQLRWLANKPYLLLFLDNNFFEGICRACNKAIGHYYQVNYLYPAAEETKNILVFILKEYGLANELAENIGDIIATFIENDNAYRFRYQDVVSETTKDTLLKNPYKEWKRLLDLFIEREMRGKDSKITGYFKNILRILRILSLTPKFKRIYKAAINNANLDNIKFDEDDKYWVLWWNTYNFFGQTFEERRKKLVEIHGEQGPPYVTFTYSPK
jgi:hypothetical protein